MEGPWLATALVVGSATAAAVTLWPTYHVDQNRDANDTSDPILGSGVGQSPTWNTPLHNFGTEANAVSDGSHACWAGWDIARSIVSTGAGNGYTLDGWGAIHQFGSASPPIGGGYWLGWDIARGISR